MTIKNRQPIRTYQAEDYGLASTTATTQLPWDQIRTNGGTQMRAGLNQETVGEYADAMRRGGRYDSFPPLTVFYDGEAYWLGDGFHRHAAACQVFGSACTLPVDVRAGTRRDAVLHAAAANAKHGLRRTNADKARAVDTLLQDEEWHHWSDNEIARRCAVSPTFVGKRRSLLTVDSDTLTARIYRTKHGTVAAMQTASIGQREPSGHIPQDTKGTAVESRPLTLNETLAVIWRGIQHHAPPTNAERLAWLRTTPIQTFKEMLQPGVTLNDEIFVKACNTVAAELRDNIAHKERTKTHSEMSNLRTLTFSRPRSGDDGSLLGAAQGAIRLLTLAKALLTQAKPQVAVYNAAHGATLTTWLEHLNEIIAELEESYARDHST